MVLNWKWSPFMKAFRGNSIVCAAIIGKQIEVVRELLQRFTYTVSIYTDELDKRTYNKKKKMNKELFGIFGKNFNANNMLHLTYLYDVPEVRLILRYNGYLEHEHDEVYNRMNFKGQLPAKLRHQLKEVVSDTSGSDSSSENEDDVNLSRNIGSPQKQERLLSVAP